VVEHSRLTQTPEAIAYFTQKRAYLYPDVHKGFILQKEFNHRPLSEILENYPTFVADVFGKHEKITEIIDAIPSDWLVRQSDNEFGIMIQNPRNLHDNIRIMPGNFEADFVTQKLPYVKRTKNGSVVDVNGVRLSSGRAANAHISLKDYKPDF
jgi:hypothetical protein